MPDTLSVKQRINKGEVIVGVRGPSNADRSLSAERSRLEDILSKGSYDFIWVDSQHAPFDEYRLAEVCLMAEEVDIPVLMRIKNTHHAYRIGNYLDLGLMGVEVPEVMYESTATESVDAFYLPPHGKRSWGGVIQRPLQGKIDRLEYVEWWKKNGILWLELESVEAVTNARQLAKPGVDCLSWGPVDMTFSLEAHPEHPFKTLDDCVKHVVKQLEGSDVRVCFRNRPEDRNKYIEMGVTVFLEWLPS